MYKKYLPWLIIGLILWFILAFFVCKTCFLGTAAAAAVPAAIPAAKAAVWPIKDGREFNASCDNDFDFNRNALNHKSVEGNMTTCMTETADYLKNNQDRELKITGLYSEQESYNGVLSNLGLARANDVKSYMLGLGVAASQIGIVSRIIPDSRIKNNILDHGVEFGFGKASDDVSSRLAAIKGRLIDAPPAVTLRFNTGDDQMNLSATQRNDFADIIYYLDNVSGSSLTIGGHTDNVGNPQSNQSLSGSRAETVKEYLAGNGISNSRMSTQGFGQTSPLNANATPAERAENRRVEVVLNHN